MGGLGRGYGLQGPDAGWMERDWPPPGRSQPARPLEGGFFMLRERLGFCPEGILTLSGETCSLSVGELSVSLTARVSS